MTALYSIKKGSTVVVKQLPVGTNKIQMIRIGITEGQMVFCLERLPGGTIIVQKNRQEIAIGADLAKQIVVEQV